MKRPWTYTIAAIIQFVVSLLAISDGLINLPQGAAALDSVDGPGYLFLIAGLILGVAGLFSAFGVWRNQRWGVIVTIIIRTIDGLAALPGLIFAPTFEWKVLASIGVLIAIVVVTLLLWPKPKHTSASSNVA